MVPERGSFPWRYGRQMSEKVVLKEEQFISGFTLPWTIKLTCSCASSLSSGVDCLAFIRSWLHVFQVNVISTLDGPDSQGLPSALCCSWCPRLGAALLTIRSPWRFTPSTSCRVAVWLPPTTVQSTTTQLMWKATTVSIKIMIIMEIFVDLSAAQSDLQLHKSAEHLKSCTARKKE